MLKVLQSMQEQELGINLKALDVPEDKLDNYAAANYKSAHNGTTATTLNTITANKNKNNKQQKRQEQKR